MATFVVSQGSVQGLTETGLRVPRGSCARGPCQLIPQVAVTRNRPACHSQLHRLVGLSLFATGFSRQIWRKARKAARVPRRETATWPSGEGCEVDVSEELLEKAASQVQQKSVALILNRNAKGVTRKVEHKLKDLPHGYQMRLHIGADCDGTAALHVATSKGDGHEATQDASAETAHIVIPHDGTAQQKDHDAAGGSAQGGHGHLRCHSFCGPVARAKSGARFEAIPSEAECKGAYHHQGEVVAPDLLMVLDPTFPRAKHDGACQRTLSGPGGLLFAARSRMLRREAVPDAVSPTMCVLRLGTGNALAYVTGAQKNFFGDLDHLVQELSDEKKPVPEIPTSTITVIPEGLPDDQPESINCFFAGLGYDARMLQDYMWLRDKTKDSTVLRKLVHNPFGYVVALLMRTLPATMRGEHVFHVKVTNLADKAYYMDSRRGDWALKHEKDAVIYEGDVGIVSVGTVPFYGGGFRLFPFAGMRLGYAHLRLSHIHPAVATFNIRHLWQGTYRDHEHVHDFLVKDVMLEVGVLCL
ncbi:unnamed protein product [Symbiodinium microadriaticum]|nr:unnamed protein product [Symbiodinium microadriaticum]